MHFFLVFQDKIRLLQEDLESERELRQRVSSLVHHCCCTRKIYRFPPVEAFAPTLPDGFSDRARTTPDPHHGLARSARQRHLRGRPLDLLWPTRKQRVSAGLPRGLAGAACPRPAGPAWHSSARRRPARGCLASFCKFRAAPHPAPPAPPRPLALGRVNARTRGTSWERLFYQNLGIGITKN